MGWIRLLDEQMLCVITPDWSGGLQLIETPHVQVALSQLFNDVGFVQFSSLALLPPRPDQDKLNLPSLLLELSLDEGIRPADALRRLVYHPSDRLWELYKAQFDDLASLTIGERREKFLALLVAQTSDADGAFVGPRDRTVAQVHKEQALLHSAKDYAKTLDTNTNTNTNTNTKIKSNRESFALAMSRWAQADSNLEWAAQPAPRSFWRTKSAVAKVAAIGFWLAMPFLIAGGVLVLGWLLQYGLAHLPYFVYRALSWFYQTTQVLWDSLPLAFLSLTKVFIFMGLDALASFSDFIRPLFIALGGLLQSFLRLGLRLLNVIFVAAIAFSLLFVVLPSFSKFWHWWLKSLSRELDRPTESWSSRVTYFYGALISVGLAVAFAAALVYVTGFSHCAMKTWNDLSSEAQDWARNAVTLYFQILVGLALFLMWALRPAKKAKNIKRLTFWERCQRNFQRFFYRPTDEETPRAQQVHPLIEKCEAKQVAGTAHMISLTELKRPYWWSALWTRVILNFVSFIGYVQFTEGALGHAQGIQFGHWHVIDKGRRLLFCASYDGTFGGYLDDFIKGISTGTTLFWRSTELLPRPAAVAGHPHVAHARAFPYTRLLFFRGVKTELTFKTYARDSMLPHSFFYAACNVSAVQRIRATELRDALFGERTDVKDDKIMRALES